MLERDYPFIKCIGEGFLMELSSVTTNDFKKRTGAML